MNIQLDSVGGSETTRKMIHLTVTVSRSTLRTEFYFCECIALLLLIQQHPLVETEIDLRVYLSVWSVPWILTTCPCRCFWTARSWWTRGLTPLRFHQIQRTPRTILCHVSSCPISSERLQWLKQFTVIQMFSLFHYNIGSIQKDLLHTCIDSDLRGKEFLEGGEDATVWNNHRCMNLHFFLTFPHFHTWKEVFSQLRIFCLQQMKN